MSQSSGESQKSQTSDKTASKTSASKTPSKSKKSNKPKKVSSKKVTPKKMTMLEMRSSLKSLETRMKRADTLTRKSVKTLESVVESLDARTKLENDTQKSALSRRVGRLSNELEEGLATTRAEIKAALASALANPNASSVESAVAQALSRLDNTETQQAQAIAKINRHLANLAKAVEDRIVKDQIAATEALGQVKIHLTQKISAVETDTATAFGAIGEKVATLSEAMETRQSRIDSEIAEKVSKLAAQTQAEFDRKTNSMEERIKTLESAEREAALQRPDALTEKMSANVSALSGQVETLQSRLSEIDASFAALQSQTDIMSQDLVQTQSALQDVKLKNETADILRQESPQDRSPPPYVSETATQTPRPHAAPSASRMSNIVNLVPGQRSGANPYSSETAPQEPAAHQETGTGSHQPVEFDASAYHQSNPYAQPNVPQQMQHSAATAFAQPNFAPELTPSSEDYPLAEDYSANEFVEQNQADPYNQAPYHDVESMPAGDPLLPYGDPAYAEADDSSMTAVPIAGSSKTDKRRRQEKRTKAPKTSGSGTTFLTARNLRVAALATGLTLITLFAARSFMSDGSEKAVNLQRTNELPQAGQAISPNDFTPDAPIGIQDDSPVLAQTLPLEETAPIGTYEGMAAPVIPQGETGTLESAARSGNPVAQFQLGLSYLEQNRVKDGVVLIRNASQTLPAAQYRLAKLYESGDGVEKDTALARELTERAARAGNRIAMHDLAIYYAYGNGDVSVDMSTAAGWFLKAAERGVVDSQFNLAILFENGQGVKPSLPDAYFWYSIAGAQGDQTAAARIASIEPQMSAADIDAAKARVASFTPVKINAAANGVFKVLPWTKKGASAPAQAKADIKQTQSLLTDLGFNIGPADGIMGKKTRDAILEFQKANSLTETGRVSAALIDRLENASRA